MQAEGRLGKLVRYGMITGALSRFLALLLGLALALAGAEVLARLAVPAQEFWSMPDLFRAVDAPDVRYTLQPRLAENAFGVDLRTNAFGFRGQEWRMPKLAGRFRIALLGDSHGFGLGVPFPDTTGEVMARLLRRCGMPDVEVMNFALNGYNSVQELGVLRAYALPLEPDLVVVLPTNNDHEPASYADESGFLNSTPTRGEGAPSWRGKVRQVAGPWLRSSRLFLWLRRRYLGWPPVWTWNPGEKTEAPPPDPGWMVPIDDDTPPAELEDAVGRPVRAMIAETRARAVPVVLASFAAPMEYRRLFRQITREEKVPWLELLTLFPEAHSWPDVVRQFGLGWDPHLNGVANERWGRALVRLIRESGYVPATGPGGEDSECDGL